MLFKLDIENGTVQMKAGGSKNRIGAEGAENRESKQNRPRAVSECLPKVRDKPCYGLCKRGASRLEAIASRLEAITTRSKKLLVTKASKLGVYAKAKAV